MRHRIAGNRIGMPEPQRRAAFRSLIDGLYIHERIHTTQARGSSHTRSGGWGQSRP